MAEPITGIPAVEHAWLDAVSDAEEGGALTARLVAIDSTPGKEGAVQHAIAGWLAEQGIAAELQPTEDDRPNVVARIVNGAGPTLLLNGHADTVLAAAGWSSHPWTPRRDGDRLYGLGACDMKSGLAVALLAARALARRLDLWRGTLIFSSVVDEEAYSIGARALIAAGIQADYCVVAESAWERPALGAVGKVLVRGEVTGKAAHASWPEGGINAASEAARIVTALERLPLGQHPRLSASQCLLSLHSGNAQYLMTVPETASFTITRHIVPGESGETVLAQMQEAAAELQSPAAVRFSIEPPYYPPWETAPEHPLAQAFARAYAAECGRQPLYGYNGFGDANLFAGEAGVPTVHFGPHGGNFHEANEWCDVPSIGGATRVLIRLALSLLR